MLTLLALGAPRPDAAAQVDREALDELIKEAWTPRTSISSLGKPRSVKKIASTVCGIAFFHLAPSKTISLYLQLLEHTTPWRRSGRPHGPSLRHLLVPVHPDFDAQPIASRRCCGASPLWPSPSPSPSPSP